MILITGGAGYVGSVLTRKLLELGERVRIFDKFYFGEESLWDVRNKVEIIKGDIREFDPKALNGVTAVVHLAALSTDPQAEYNPEATLQINTVATENLASMVKKRKIGRFIFASSASVYYTTTREEIATIKNEQMSVFPTVPYAKSKYVAEQKLLRMTGDGFCPVILRKGTIFGVSPRMRYDLVVNTFVRDAFSGGRLYVNAGGEAFRPLVHINDAVEAYIALLLASEEKVRGEVFNLVHKNYWVLSLAHWVKYVLREKKQIEVDVSYQGQDGVRSYYVSGEKMSKTMGFCPAVGINKGVLELWERLEKNELADFQNEKYYNIKQMEKLIAEKKIGREL
ncbi:MAG: SDR family oxidoreductase [Candidatus Omnitrophota bacterium]